ncbi:MAG: 30S ribosome-binding factor RbfA [Actinomycetota bacterium]|nr:30S ribosome-binding factor RbfA [Actinomycetota bacterium]
MTEGTRPSRVSEEFREVLAEEIPKLKDPRVGFVTVTSVRVTADLRKAHVLYSVLGDDAAKSATRAALNSARPHLRSVLGRQVRLKFLPDLEFEEDDSFDRLQRIDRLLKESAASQTSQADSAASDASALGTDDNKEEA